ncbi:MAG TPA: glutathione peroxidase [Bacteroidia bacterium]|nr:glutathione peroxidase [Bacteroidia bacterium]
MQLLILLIGMITLQSQNFYSFHVRDINGKEFDFSQFKGKKILLVNTASECGYTRQYEGLEKLYKEHKEHLVIVAFPANNFGGQEPGTNEEISLFCQKNYGVTFPVMAKISVKGDDTSPLFKWLTSKENPDFTGDINWNFEKFLLDENGNLVHRYRSKVAPDDPKLLQDILKKY